jgi:signal transduction histidine kinase/tetratricopeptide (TPR) repeat protein
MTKKFFSLLIFLICTSQILNAQEKTGNVIIDSLFKTLPNIKIDTVRVNTLNLIAEEFKNQDPNQAIIYCNQALQLSKKIKWNDGIALSLKNIGQNKIVLGDIDAADKCFDQAFSYAESKLNKCLIYRAKGAVSHRKSNFPKALEYCFMALKIGEEIKDEKEMAEIYLEIGRSYNMTKDLKNALLYLNKALVINNKLKSKRQISKNLQYIGRVYRDYKKIPLAIDYISKALKISTEINDKDGIAVENLSLGILHNEQQEFEIALPYILAAKKMAEDIKNNRYIYSCKLFEAEIYVKQFSLDQTNSKKRILLNKAEPLLLDAIENFKKCKDLDNESGCYEILSRLYSLQNNYKKANEFLLHFTSTQDSIYNEKTKETVKSIEDQRTIDLKNKEIQINKITIESKEKQKWFYILGIGFLGILGVLLFYQSSKRKKTNEKLQLLNSELDQANKSKVKFLSILNHDLRSPVYNFIHFMQLQKESPELLDAETKKMIETKTIASAENLLGSMEDLLLWSKGQMDNFEPQPKTIVVNSLFEDTQKHFESEEKVKFTFENASNIEMNTDENFLKTIIRNLTGNAIKALKSNSSPETIATIAWKAWREHNKTYLSITDNGSGASQEQFKALYDENEVVGIKTGLGLHLIRDLAKAIGCEVLVESNPITGTTFKLQITD